MMLQEQQPPPPTPQQLLLSGGDSYSSHEKDGQYHLNDPRWQNLHVWYEFLLRDGYAPPDGSKSYNNDHDYDELITVDTTSTNFWKLYEYRKKLFQTLFGISTGNTVNTTTTTRSWSDGTATSNYDENSNRSSSKATNQTTSIASMPIQATILSPKFIRVSDLILSSSRKSLCFENHNRNHHQHGEQHYNHNQRGEFESFEFQLISDATGASLLTIDSTYWRDDSSYWIDDTVLVSNLTLFPNILQPSHHCTVPSLDLLCMNDDSTTNTTSSHEQHPTQPHSMNLYRQVHNIIHLPIMLPCQQLVSQDGCMYTIIGCAREDDDQCIEFRFWRIAYISDNRSTNSRVTEGRTLHQSTGISVERYGFCRIPLAGIYLSWSFAYHYPTANSYINCHRSDTSIYVDRPCVFICYRQEEEHKAIVAAYRIHPWREDNNVNDVDDPYQIDKHECMTMIYDAEYVHEILHPYRDDPCVARPRIAGKTVLSDGSTILVVYVKHDIQLWNMTTTATTGGPNITCVKALECMQNLIKTYFPPHTFLYDTFVRSVPEGRFYSDHVSSNKTLPIDIYGFFTFNFRATPHNKGLQLYWEFDFVTLSWRISSIIILPVSDERHVFDVPKFYYDGQKLVVLGHDNLGYILLIYQILWVEDETAQNIDDALNMQSCVRSNLRHRFEESGGVYNFPYDLVHDDNDFNGYSTPPQTPIRRQRRKIQFKRRIRHESLGFGRGEYNAKMQMSCNERFILVRIADNTRDPDRIISFDLDSSEFDV